MERVPVNGGDDRAEGEARVVVVVLVPDAAAVVAAVAGGLDGIVDGDDG